MDENRKLGLYWARIDERWYIVDWRGLKSNFSGWLSMVAFIRDRRVGDQMAMTRIDPNDVDEWGERITEP